jgi:hypothetical protein
MKGRPFLAVVLAVVLLTFSLALGGWWLIGQRGPLQLAHHALSIPRAARFVPAQAPLSLYLLSDGEQPVAYARAVAPGRQRRPAGEAIARLRDGAFAAAGLDYHDELSRWLAPGMALVLFDDPAALDSPRGAASGLPTGGWLLALSSRDDVGARQFLQRFWQTRSLAGTDLQVSSYRGMGLISGRGALVGSRSVPLATALVDDDLVLIASGRGLLERALDVSQIPELNQASQPGLQGELDRLGEGAALLLARPQALEQWLGWPLPPAASGQRPIQLLASLRPDGRQLVVHGHLQLPATSQAVLPSDRVAPASSSPTQATPTNPVPPQPQAPTATDPGPQAPTLAGSIPVAPIAAAPTPAAPAATEARAPRGNDSTGRGAEQPIDSARQQQLLAGLRGQLTSLLVLQDPADQLQQPLLQPLVERALASTLAGAAGRSGAEVSGRPGGKARGGAERGQASGRKAQASALEDQPLRDPLAPADRSGAASLPLLVAQRAEGPLLVASGPLGWQMGTASDQPAPGLLEPSLAAQGLIQAPLQLGDRSLQVWTRLEARGLRGGGESLQASLAAWRQASGPLAWWGRNLAVFDPPETGRGNPELQAALDSLDRAEAPLQWTLTAGPTRDLLRSWLPWQRLSALAGGGLDGAVRGLVLALEPEGSTLHLQVRLRFDR